MNRLLIAGTLVLAACCTACGSSTVTDNNAASTTPTTTQQAASTSSTPPVVNTDAAAPAAPSDGPAEEVSAIPSPAQQLSDADKSYFDALNAGGIKVEGAENQMIGAAQVVCQNQFPQALQAVGGQLVEQQRTTLTLEAAVSLIESSARKAYCP